jgi:hypothetical protein
MFRKLSRKNFIGWRKYFTALIDFLAADDCKKTGSMPDFLLFDVENNVYLSYKYNIFKGALYFAFSQDL